MLHSGFRWGGGGGGERQMLHTKIKGGKNYVIRCAFKCTVISISRVYFRGAPPPPLDF